MGRPSPIINCSVKYLFETYGLVAQVYCELPYAEGLCCPPLVHGISMCESRFIITGDYIHGNKHGCDLIVHSKTVVLDH